MCLCFTWARSSSQAPKRFLLRIFHFNQTLDKVQVECHVNNKWFLCILCNHGQSWRFSCTRSFEPIFRFRRNSTFTLKYIYCKFIKTALWINLQTEIYKNFRAELNIPSVNVVNKGMGKKTSTRNFSTYYLLIYLLAYLLIYLLTYLLTHSLTSWSRVLLEKLTGL
jgi:hypothetical protein